MTTLYLDPRKVFEPNVMIESSRERLDDELYYKLFVEIFQDVFMTVTFPMKLKIVKDFTSENQTNN